MRSSRLPRSAANPPLQVTTTTLPPGNVATPYAVALTATGGELPWTWSIASGSLPDGLTVDLGGIISGTPTVSGTFPFSAKVTDGVGATATKPLSITINPQLTITTAALPHGVAGVPYSATLASAGGTAPFVWSHASGTLPGGLSIGTDGVISGTPSVAGDFTFTARVDDAAASFATQPLLLTIDSPLSITTTSLPAATSGVAYSATVNASGGTTPYTWTPPASGLPNGITLGTDGTLSGTTTAVGTSTFTVTVTDAASSVATKSLSITVNPPPLKVTTTSLPGATAGSPYSATLGAAGGTPAYTWSVSSGALPGGLTLSTGGVVGGTPAASGSSTFTVRVTDSKSGSATKNLTLTVAAAPPTTTTTTTTTTTAPPPTTTTTTTTTAPADPPADPGPSGISLTADNVSPRRHGRVTLTAQVSQPPKGGYFVVIVDVSRSRLVAICGAHTICRAHDRHRAGPHVYEARLVGARWRAPWRTLAVSPRVTVTWAPGGVVIQHPHP